MDSDVLDNLGYIAADNFNAPALMFTDNILRDRKNSKLKESKRN